MNKLMKNGSMVEAVKAGTNNEKGNKAKRGKQVSPNNVCRVMTKKDFMDILAFEKRENHQFNRFPCDEIVDGMTDLSLYQVRSTMVHNGKEVRVMVTEIGTEVEFFVDMTFDMFFGLNQVKTTRPVTLEFIHVIPVPSNCPAGKPIDDISIYRFISKAEILALHNEFPSEIKVEHDGGSFEELIAAIPTDALFYIELAHFKNNSQLICTAIVMVDGNPKHIWFPQSVERFFNVPLRIHVWGTPFWMN